MHYCTVLLFVAYCNLKGVFKNTNEMFDDTLDRSFKVCEPKEEFADVDVCDMNSHNMRNLLKTHVNVLVSQHHYRRLCYTALDNHRTIVTKRAAIA